MKRKSLKIGDFVYVNRPHTGKQFQKFQDLRMGPFRIIGIQGDSVKLISLDTGKTKNFHKNRVSLAPFKESFLDDSDELRGKTKIDPKNQDKANITIKKERVKQEEQGSSEEEEEEAENENMENEDEDYFWDDREFRTPPSHHSSRCLLYTSPSPRDRG